MCVTKNPSHNPLSFLQTSSTIFRSSLLQPTTTGSTWSNVLLLQTSELQVLLSCDLARRWRVLTLHPRKDNEMIVSADRLILNQWPVEFFFLHEACVSCQKQCGQLHIAADVFFWVSKFLRIYIYYLTAKHRNRGTLDHESSSFPKGIASADHDFRYSGQSAVNENQGKGVISGSLSLESLVDEHINDRMSAKIPRIQIFEYWCWIYEPLLSSHMVLGP